MGHKSVELGEVNARAVVGELGGRVAELSLELVASEVDVEPEHARPVEVGISTIPARHSRKHADQASDGVAERAGLSPRFVEAGSVVRDVGSLLVINAHRTCSTTGSSVIVAIVASTSADTNSADVCASQTCSFAAMFTLM
jgi:hypothetical protein